MKLTFAFLSLLIASSSALAVGTPLMECEGKEGSIQINVGVDRSVINGAFQDKLMATSQQTGHSAVRLLADEVVQFKIAAGQNRAYVGRTVSLDLQYVDELNTNSSGGYDRVFDGTLKASGEMHQVLCTLHDHM